MPESLNTDSLRYTKRLLEYVVTTGSGDEKPQRIVLIKTTELCWEYGGRTERSDYNDVLTVL